MKYQRLRWLRARITNGLLRIGSTPWLPLLTVDFVERNWYHDQEG